MRIEHRLERGSFPIWTAVLIAVATASLIGAVAASAAAIRGMLAEPPLPPAELKPEYRTRTVPPALSLERFKLTERGGPAPWPESAPGAGSAEALAGPDVLQQISRNVDEYIKRAFPPVVPIPEATQWDVSRVMQSLNLKNDAEERLYLGTLEALSEELARSGPEQAQLPEARRIDPHRVLRWHADSVRRLLRSVDNENARLQKLYTERLHDYAGRNARSLLYIAVAAGAIAIFLFAMFLVIIVRVERDLHTMALASVVTTRRLEG
ncbi:MAG TPA: hypothetical protein VFK15_00310 [Burkholderiales bacterium]|jgi:hypothetical protein|nr:hypothetical protein [Burkholderiales bacterium]